MSTVDFENLDKIGVIRDVKPYQLPPEAWTLGLNMRMGDDDVRKMLGWEQAFGTPPVAPHFTIPLSTSSQNFWLYFGLAKAYVWDGTNHTNITRQSAGVDVDYTAITGSLMNGTIIGGVPILNNAVDVPQFWETPTVATKLKNLTGWDASWRTRTVRSFGAYLMAFNVTKSGTNFPHLVKWSHAVADPGTVPQSWDETDETLDAGEYDLPDVNSGVLLDALPLGSKMFIYKEGSVWAARFIGGRFIFQFEAFLDTVGLLAPRCVSILGDGRRQLFVSQDDILVHNGNTVDSILDGKRKKTLFADIDTDNFVNCFTLTNPAFDEVGFFYPRQGEEFPTTGLIWNYKKNTLTDMDGVTFRGGAIGRIEEASSETWEDGNDTWEDDTGPWSEVQRRKLVTVGPANTKFYKMDSGLTRDGTVYGGTLQRVGLSFIGKKRDGSPIVDHQVRKLIQRIWPKIVGGPIRVRVGIQDTVDGPITWGNYNDFDPLSMMTVDDVVMEGRAIGVEFSDVGGVDWFINGYKMDLVLKGKF